MNNNFRRLGQYFLTNKPAAHSIVHALELETKDIIIEIGPGKGFLTLPLLQNCKRLGCKMIAIEKDQKLAVNLLKKFEHENIEIIHGDVLKEIQKVNFSKQNIKLAGNIPYYITGRLLRILSDLKEKPNLTVLTIQKEVAERIISKPPKMNLLAAISQFWADPKIIKLLQPENFSPKPKVKSAIIILKTKTRDFDHEKYYKFVKILFKQPRKTIFNNLKFGIKLSPEKILEILRNNNLTGSERPQNLKLNMLIKLARDYSRKDML